MPKILTLAEEISAAIVLLRSRDMPRAAIRLEKLSEDILDPKPPKKRGRRATRVAFVGGSGRKWSGKLVLPPEELSGSVLSLPEDE